MRLVTQIVPQLYTKTVEYFQINFWTFQLTVKRTKSCFLDLNWMLLTLFKLEVSFQYSLFMVRIFSRYHRITKFNLVLDTLTYKCVNVLLPRRECGQKIHAFSSHRNEHIFHLNAKIKNQSFMANKKLEVKSLFSFYFAIMDRCAHGLMMTCIEWCKIDWRRLEYT